MDNDSDVSAFTLRNPPFTKAEISTLIDLVEEHKSVLLDKATKAAACYAKEAAWASITVAFNSQGFPFKRTTESIKLKWDNIKKSTRKKARESLNGFYDPVTNRLVKLLADHNLLYDSKIGRTPDCSMDDEDISLDDIQSLNNETNSHSNPEDNLHFNKTNSNEIEDLNSKLRPFSKLRNYVESNFTELECERLLICVKPEKQYVFSKETSNRTKELKNKAWERIAATFNKNKSEQRTAKCLRKKFESMKTLAKKLKVDDSDNSNIFTSNSHDTRLERVCKLEKTETDASYEDYTEEGNNDSDNFLLSTLHNDDSNQHPRLMPNENSCDPLGNVLNGFCQDDDNDYKSDLKKLVKLKIELAKYKLEMAKESRRQRKEAHEALLESIAIRTRLAELTTKKTELEISMLKIKQKTHSQSGSII